MQPIILTDSPLVVDLKREFRALAAREEELLEKLDANSEPVRAIQKRQAEIAAEINQSLLTSAATQ